MNSPKDNPYPPNFLGDDMGVNVSSELFDKRRISFLLSNLDMVSLNDNPMNARERILAVLIENLYAQMSEPLLKKIAELQSIYNKSMRFGSDNLLTPKSMSTCWYSQQEICLLLRKEAHRQLNLNGGKDGKQQ